MKHYVCLLKESNILKDAFLSYHFVNRDDGAPFELVNELMGDRLDIERAIAFFQEEKGWNQVVKVTSFRELPDGSMQAGSVRVESGFNGRVSWTIDEALIGDVGRVTGLFFAIDGSFLYKREIGNGKT